MLTSTQIETYLRNNHVCTLAKLLTRREHAEAFLVGRPHLQAIRSYRTYNLSNRCNKHQDERVNPWGGRRCD